MKFDSMDIVKAMQIIADSSNSRLKLDKTITAQIVSVENVETGEYRVKYEGNSFLAYSYDVKTTFKVDENVYVKIPENDMSNRKIIEGRVSSVGNSLSDILEQQVEVNLIEPSLDKFYGYDKNKTWGLVAGVDKDHPNFSQTIFEAPADAQGDHFFQHYTKNYKKLRISGSFFTNFAGQHDKGNYGLIVTFRTIDGDNNIGRISYRLDFSSFVGDPYRYTSPSPQSVIIDVFEQSILGLDSILLFQENFETDKSLNYDKQVIYENKGTDNPPVCNIFVKDIDISFCEVIDLKDTSYYLTIVTPLGSVFSGSTTSLALEARLKFQGKNILSSSSCQCYWYKENLEIRKGIANYDKLAGVRWEKINQADENYLPRIMVDSSEVKSHARYKLVVVYQDVILSKEVEITQYNSDYDVEIRQRTRSNSRIILEVVSKKENDNRLYSGDWYFLLPDGSYDLISGGENVEFIDVTDYLIYPTATFYCQVYHNDEPISIERHDFAISDSQDDLTLTYIGQEIYQYDANGDVAYEDTELDRTLGIEVEWKEGYGAAYTVSYLAPDGVELGYDRTKAHTPANSMMQNLWVDSTSVLHYNINQKYNINYNNNVITIKIKCTSNGNEYQFRKELLFLKDGDQGTNGTTYICAIRPVDLKNGLKLNGFHALEYNGGWIGSGLNLRCYIYKNGELINNDSNFTLEYNWECGSQNASKADKLRISTISGFTNQDDYRNIQGVGTLDTNGDYVLKITITVREKTNNERTQIYCQYPVDIAVGGLLTEYLDMNLPSYVKYTASGLNAAYLNQQLKCSYRGNDLSIYPTNKTILDIKDGKLNPAQKFVYSGGIAALRCEVTSTMYLLHPIMMYLDTYGNEAINGWDGTKLEIDKNGKYLLAPQIGAGEKESDNTFTGVVMGKDTAQEKTGLYGYRHGIAQFGFKEDGTAFIGASGDGQILFNGAKGTITSGNYSSTSGMKIDLSNGHIDSYNFKISSGNMLLDSANQKFDFQVGSSTNSRFQIKNKDGDILFHIANGAYYLQSQDYKSGESGTKFNLATGRIDSYNFQLKTSTIDLDSATARFTFKVDQSKSSSYFRIISTTNDGSQVLFNASNNNYYLRSADYSASSGMYINLNKGSITAWNFSLRSSCLTINSANNQFQFNVSPADGTRNGSFSIRAGSTTLMNVSENSYYLQSSNYTWNANNKTGVYINLQTGVFRAGGSAEFDGTITANSGSIGGWRINTWGLGNDNIYLYSNGNARFGSDCYISNGILTANNAVIQGNITASTISANDGYIGGWKLSSTSLSGGSTTLDSRNGITTKTLNIADGYHNGTIGAESTSTGDGYPTFGVGLNVNDNVVAATTNGTKFQVGSWYLALTSSHLITNVPASSQSGIYARFG